MAYTSWIGPSVTLVDDMPQACLIEDDGGLFSIALGHHRGLGIYGVHITYPL